MARTEEVKIYTFDELSETAQKKAIEDYRKHLIIEDENNALECLPDYCADLLKSSKIEIVKDFRIYYSLSYSQGDGFCFVGLFKWKSYYITIKKSSCHYNHERSTDIYGESIKTGKEWSNKAEEEFKQIYLSICKKCEREGYTLIENCNDDAVISDNIKSNEYEYTADGKRF